MKYLVHLRETIGEVSTEGKVIDGRVFRFVPSGYIKGGHADGEVKMVPVDANYPDCGPDFIGLGDLMLID
jgi:hypothetical protein